MRASSPHRKGCLTRKVASVAASQTIRAVSQAFDRANDRTFVVHALHGVSRWCSLHPAQKGPPVVYDTFRLPHVACTFFVWVVFFANLGCWLKPLDSWSPRSDAGPRAFIAGTANANVTCVWTNTGRVSCWGSGAFFASAQIDDAMRPITLDLGAATREPVIDLALAEYDQACAVTSGGRLVCWRNGTRLRSPEVVANVVNARRVVAGEKHVCALTADGHVYCRGEDSYGQLGRGEPARVEDEFARVVEASGTELSNVVDLAAGLSHTCARKRDGTLWCWGGDDMGQLGHGAMSDEHCVGSLCRRSARQVVGFTLAAGDPEPQSLAAGARHTCARRASDNSLWCWGQANSYGFAPSGPFLTNTDDCNGTACRLVPRRFDGVTNVLRVAAGKAYTCVLRADAAQPVRCWGVSIPTREEAIEGITGTPAALIEGDEHACVITTTGAVQCWGNAANGTIAHANNVRPFATQVNGLSGATALAVGEQHSCAVVNGGAVHCWGANFSHQLGDGTALDRGQPVTVRDATGVTQLGAGNEDTCGRRADGTVLCWGRNQDGQHGPVWSRNEAQDPHLVQESATPDGGTEDRPLVGVRAVAVGGRFTCALRGAEADGGVECWGYNEHCQTTRQDAGSCPATSPHADRQTIQLAGMIVAAIGAGDEHACARGALDGGVGGGVSCWGFNAWGQAAPAEGGMESVLATPVMGVTAATDVAGGKTHSCAVVAGGAVVCWGNDRHGALGPPQGGRGPRQVVASGAVALSVGDLFACARMNNQTVQCWGYNAYGQLGDGTLTDRPTPAPVRTSAQSVLDNVVEVSANTRHACARRADGTVWCWGSDLCGQLGRGQTCRLSRATPIAW